jgi:hypothetical protein
MRVAFTDSLDGTSPLGPGKPYFWNESGDAAGPWPTKAAADTVIYDNIVTGNYVFPPDYNAKVTFGSATYDTAPVGTGTNRMAELTADLEPQFERFAGRYFCGFAGLYQFQDLLTI